ncbi:hypothetical protein EJ04DRAFT_507289 [Polyplosphaeria fusca]|uniref:Uncharacterized protein n=1 Tax=Polyplosphaeria fusca TaxID=682080 RepID=A0A9P4RD83_9PLEO|nr:hypothetical protein EJ04DRAFT_507289 [Polyplosphaeria fusca]
MGADVRGKENKVYRRSVYRAWDEGHAVVAEMIQDFKKARYGLADCVSTEVILDSMNQLALEIEPYEETSSEPACYEIVGPTDQVVL